ncbi:MAG: hypothetical protein ACI9TI_000213 [Natronomonas sp.]|jgi:hypothetical protein
MVGFLRVHPEEAVKLTAAQLYILTRADEAV